MSIWGTTRSLQARFEVGQGSGDLHASLEVGQNSRDLPTRLLIRDIASTDLYGSFVATRSRDLLGKVDIRHSATLDLPSRTEIQNVGSANLEGTAYVVHSVALHCKFDVGQGAVEVLARVEVRQPGSADLLGGFEAQAIGELLGRADVRGLNSAEVLGKFEVGQGVAELLARGEVGQGSIDLLGRCDIRLSSSADLLTRLSIPTSVDLLARFRPAQEVLNLSGRLVVRHPAFPIGLGGSFSVGLTNTYLDMRSALTVMRSAYPELVSGFVVRRAGISVELLGKAVIRHRASVELPSKAGVRHTGAVELACNFVTQSFGDLTAKMMVLPGIPGYITWYDPASWVNVVVGAGRGFIAMPWVEVDADVKVTENSSARLTSAQSGRGYKEIRFGWDGTCAGGLDLRREVPADDGLDLGAVSIIRHRGIEDLPGGLEVAHRSSEGLPAGFEIQDFERLFARFYMFFRSGEDLRAKFRPGQEILDLPARFTIRQSGTAELRAGIVDFVRHIDLTCNLVVRHSVPLPPVEYPLSYVFTEGTGSPYDIIYDTIDGIGPVTIAQSEYSSATGYSNQRKLVGTSRGILYAVYFRALSGVHQVYVKESADYGLTWTNETRISTYAGMESDYQYHPSIAIDSNDRLHVVWRGGATGYPTYDQIWYALYDGSWHTPVRISTYAGMSSNYQYPPSIAVDSNDYLHVVWYGRATGYTTYYQIWYALYDGSWHTPVRISTYAGMSSNYQYSPCIAVDSGNDLHIVWRGRATGFTTYYQIWYALYDGSWADPVRISTYAGMSGDYQYSPCIAVDSGNDLHVVWYGEATGFANYYQIWYAVYAGSWAAPVRISTYSNMASYDQYLPSIIVGGDDYLHVVWYGGATGYPPYKIWYAEYTTSWASPEVLQPTGYDRYPNLLIPPEPRVIVTDVKGVFEVGQDQENLPGECVIGQVGIPVELLGKADIRQSGSADAYAHLIVRNIGSTELLSKIAWIRLRAAQLLGKFDVGQGSGELLGRFEVGQGSIDLFANVEVGQASQDLEATLFVGFPDSKDLSARFKTGTGIDWLPDWSHREKHQIIGSAVGTLMNYPVSITVHYGSGTDTDDDVYCDANCRTDFGDIRFTAYNGSTLLDYWLQEKIDSDYAIFWVEVDEIPKAPAWAIIYFYYDNPGATYTDPQQHGKDTFTAFDDFPGVALDGQWTVDANISVTVADGKLTCKATASSWDTWHGIHMAVANVQGIRLESYGVDYGHVSSDLFQFGQILGVDWTHRNLGYILKDSHASTPECYLRYLYDNDVLAKGDIEGQHDLTLVAQRDQNGDVKFFKDGAEQQVGTETSNDSFDSLMIIVNRYLTYASPDLEIERVLARKYVDPEPTHGTWG